MKLMGSLISIMIVLEILAIEGRADSRWKEWPRIPGAIASRGTLSLNVYSDPEDSSNFVICPEMSPEKPFAPCWLTQRKKHHLSDLGSGKFRLKGGNLFYDTTFGVNPQGVEWNDSKRENWLSLTLTRRPQFGKTEVTIWDDTEWIKVVGLPPQ